VLAAIPVLVLALVALGLVSVWLPDRGKTPSLPPQVWFPILRGSVEFLGGEEEFRVLRRAGEELYRIERTDKTAFESPRLERVAEMFLREVLYGLHVGEALRIHLTLDPDGASAPNRPFRSGLTWAISLEEDATDSERWFRSPHGRTGAPLHARSVEALKAKIARELAQDLVAYHAGELTP
jgi:hypothetical protein